MTTMNRVEVKQEQNGNAQRRLVGLAYFFFFSWQVDVLMEDALEVLDLVRVHEGQFHVYRSDFPAAILSLIPEYWDRQDQGVDKCLVALTHVCRAWRALYISHPSLWSRLDFTNVNKTLAYVERSRSSPLQVVLRNAKQKCYLENAFLLAEPHFGRFQSPRLHRNPGTPSWFR